MAVIATDTQRLSNLIKKTDAELLELFTKVVTVNEASQQTYDIGTVLGKVTATGKYIISKTGAVDGSQVPAAVVIGDSFGTYHQFTVPATTDTKVLVLKRGKMIISKSALQLDAGWTGSEQTVYDALEALGLIVDTTI